MCRSQQRTSHGLSSAFLAFQAGGKQRLIFEHEEGQDRVCLLDWKSRRNEVAFILSKFDVRVIEIPPNALVARQKR
jgi:hypothetical protein